MVLWVCALGTLYTLLFSATAVGAMVHTAKHCKLNVNAAYSSSSSSATAV